MTMTLTEVGVILLLVLANGVFAVSEMAIVSARKSRLRHLSASGDRGARIALELADDPNRFLATVQIGITLVGTLAGVFGGATLAENLAAWLGQFPPLVRYSEPLGLGVVVLGITYLSLIFGELVPKRLALGNPERVASVVASPLRWLSIVAVPVVRLLSVSTEVVLRILRIRPEQATAVTDEEITGLMSEGAQAGVFELAEHDMVKRVLRLGDRRARVLMTPRAEIAWVDAADSPEEIRRKITASPHSRLIVCEGELDKLLGVVQAKDLLVRGLAQQPIDIRGALTMPLLIYEGTPGLKVLEMFQRTGTHIAVVLDEYGSVEGILTTNDILEAIVGDLPVVGLGETDPKAVRRPDGSWLFDGTLAIDELRDYVAIGVPPEGNFHTMAGLVLARLGRIPSVAEYFDWNGFRFEVVDMDGNRVDKVLVTPSGELPAG